MKMDDLVNVVASHRVQQTFVQGYSVSGSLGAHRQEVPRDTCDLVLRRQALNRWFQMHMRNIR